MEQTTSHNAPNRTSFRKLQVKEHSSTSSRAGGNFLPTSFHTSTITQSILRHTNNGINSVYMLCCQSQWFICPKTTQSSDS